MTLSASCAGWRRHCKRMAWDYACIRRSSAGPSKLAASFLPQEYLAGGLGRWFADEKNEFIRRRPEYEAAKQQYREVHALAQGLCRSVEQARSIGRSEYEAFAAAITRLDSNLDALINELWDLLRYTDPLTGIATRYAMLPRLREEHQRVRRTGVAEQRLHGRPRPLQKGERYRGHQADAVLEAVSAYLVSNLRRYDQVCRYGGEEFVLMLPNTEPAQAAPIVDRLRRGLAALRSRSATRSCTSPLRSGLQR